MYTSSYMTKEDFDKHYDWIVLQVQAIVGLDVKISFDPTPAPYGEGEDEILLHLSFEEAKSIGEEDYRRLEGIFTEKLGTLGLSLLYPCTKCESKTITSSGPYFPDLDSEGTDMFYLCDPCRWTKRDRERDDAQRAEELTCGLCGTSFKRLGSDGERPWLAKVHVGLREEKQDSPFQFTERTKILWNGVIEGECFCSIDCALGRIEQHLETVRRQITAVRRKPLDRIFSRFHRSSS